MWLLYFIVGIQIHAKPIIDMLIEVKDLNSIHGAEMEALGYTSSIKVVLGYPVVVIFAG